MSESVRRRPMKDEEKAVLDRFLKSYRSRTRQGAENALVMWAVLMLAFFALWKLLAWLGNWTLRIDAGMQSHWAPEILAFGLLSTLTIAWVSTLRWVKATNDSRPQVQSDLSMGEVVDERIHFTAVKRFVIAEQGCAIHFLHTTDDRVFVIYDWGKRQQGIDFDDQVRSLHPKTEFHIARAPKSGFVVSRNFSGAELELSTAVEIVTPPDIWPTTDEFCDIPWADLESRLVGHDRSGGLPIDPVRSVGVVK